MFLQCVFGRKKTLIFSCAKKYPRGNFHPSSRVNHYWPGLRARCCHPKQPGGNQLLTKPEGRKALSEMQTELCNKFSKSSVQVRSFEKRICTELKIARQWTEFDGFLQRFSNVSIDISNSCRLLITADWIWQQEFLIRIDFWMHYSQMANASPLTIQYHIQILDNSDIKDHV